MFWCKKKDELHPAKFNEVYETIKVFLLRNFQLYPYHCVTVLYHPLESPNTPLPQSLYGKL